MKKVVFSFFTLCFFCTPLFFASCDKVKDKIDEFSTVEVELGEVSFDIPLSLDAEKASSQIKRMDTDGFVPFSGQSKEISLNSSMFGDLQKYNGNQITLLVSSVTIKITVSNGSGTIVKDFTTTAKEKDVAEILSSYNKSEEISLGGNGFSDSKLTAYMANIFTAIQDGKTVVVDAKGKTNIVPDDIEEATVAVATIIPTLKAEVKLLKNKD